MPRILPPLILALMLIATSRAAGAREPEPDLVPATLKAMLKDYRRYTETLWHAVDGHPDMGYWGTGRADWNNEGVRAVSNTALACAVLYREGDRAFEVKERIEPALRYATAIYNNGPLKSTDGRQWGDGWQTAMWAANLGVTAWLVRDQLDPKVLDAVRRVVATEADRFVRLSPPTMLPGDTKAEENAWNLTAPAAALLLMPDHPHAKDWHQAVLRWGFNTMSVEADRSATGVLDGKPVGEWVMTTQLFPDYTLDNHGFFHPVYAMVAPATLGHAAVACRLAGRPVPEALKFNVLKGWDTLKFIVLPDGEWLYPQGLDWELHDYEHVHYFAMLATLYREPSAALLEKRLVEASRRRQVLNGDGRFVGASSRLGFAREAVQAERTAFALLMHQQFGSPPPSGDRDWDRMVASLPPSRSFERAGFVLHRTLRGVASFSWKNHLMGVVVPDSREHLDQPYVTTPHLEGMAGGFTVEGRKPGEAFTVDQVSHSTGEDGFLVRLRARVNGGALLQCIAVASVTPGVVVYLDRVSAEQDVTILEERGQPIGIENHELTGDRRLFTSDGRSLVMRGGDQKETALPGRWVNVEGRLGVVSLAGPALLYRGAGTYNRSGAREDTLFGAYRSGKREFRKGDLVAERAGLFLLNATPEETSRMADSARVLRAGDETVLTFTAPGGKTHTLSLDDQGLARLDGGP